jgi:imidazolonepropionase-like amidohydrolase
MPDSTTVIRVGRLLDVETGELLAAREIVVTDGRVKLVRPWTAPLDDGATVIDLSATTVLPGLIDCHAHLIGDIEGSDVPSIAMSEAQEVLIGARNAAATLRAGFTTVRDVGTFRAFLDCALRDAIDEGWVAGPRMQCAGAYVTAPEGGGELTGLPVGTTRPANSRVGVVHDEAEVRAAVRRILDGGADLIKVIATGAVLTRGTDINDVEVSEPLIRVAVEEAAARGAFVAAHAHGSEGIKHAIRAGVRSVEHGSLLDDDGIELMLRHGTFWVPDIYDGDWIDERGRREGWPAETLAKNGATTDAQRAAFTRGVEAGVAIAYGTDSGVYPHGLNARQFAYMVRHGMTPLAAIRSATTIAAALMGWSDRVGSLQPGRWADLVAVDGDPLSDITALERPAAVVQGGRLIEIQRASRAPGASMPSVDRVSY